jgi:hypothetical protein
MLREEESRRSNNKIHLKYPSRFLDALLLSGLKDVQVGKLKAASSEQADRGMRENKRQT